MARALDQDASGDGNDPGIYPLALWVCVAVGLGVCLRIDGLNRKSLWIDETLTIARVSHETTAATINALEHSPFPPLYYLIVRGWTRLVGLNDHTIRIPALAFGLLAMPATYFAWRPLIGRRASLWALALLSLSAYHNWYSGDAKMYSLVWILSTLSSAAFLHLTLGDARRFVWSTVYAVSCGCLPLVSYVGIAPHFVQVVYALGLIWLRPDSWCRVLRAGLVGIAALIPFALWSPVAFEVAGKRPGLDWIGVADLSRVPTDLVRLFGTFLLGYRTADGPTPQGVWWSALFGIYGLSVLATGVLLAVSLVESLQSSDDRDPVPPATNSSHRVRPTDKAPSAVIAYLTLWLLLPVFETLLFSLTVYSIWNVPRYLTSVAPALNLWFAVALGTRRAKAALALGGGVLAGNLLVIAFDRTHVTRTSWRDLAQTLVQVNTVMTLLDASPPRTSSGSGTGSEPLMLLVQEGERHPIQPLNHALNRQGSKLRVMDISFESAQRDGRPFFLIRRYPATAPSDVRRIVEEPPDAPGFWCCRLRSDLIYETRLSTEPNPFGPFVMDFWLYFPNRGPSRSVMLPESQVLERPSL